MVNITAMANKTQTTKRRRRVWSRFVRVLAMVVVFCTTYALILPAITMEKSAVCGLEEHTHSEACYATSEWECPLQEHTHIYACYPAESREYTYSDETAQVSVILPKDTAVPADAVLEVTAIESDAEGYDALVEQAEDTVDGEVKNIALYDISFYTAEENYIPVEDSAQVSLRFVEPPVDPASDVVVLHYDDEDSNPRILEDVTVEEQPTEETTLSAVSETQTVLTFQTEGFSTFAVIEVESTSYSEVIPPDVVYNDNIRNILTNDQIWYLDGQTVTISTNATRVYGGQNYGYYAVSSDNDGNHLVGVPVDRPDAGEYPGSYIKEPADDRILWEVTAAEAANYPSYTFKSVETGRFLNLEDNNDQVVLGGEQVINVMRIDDPAEADGVIKKPVNDTPIVRLGINDDGIGNANDANRELSLRDADGLFYCYKNNEYNRLNLSVRTIETNVLAKKTTYGVNGVDHPLDGKYIAISTYNDLKIRGFYAGITQTVKGYTDSDNDVSRSGLSALTVSRIDDKVYIGDDMLWRFEAVPGKRDIYYIQAYNAEDKTLGGYIQVKDGNYVTLSEKKEDNCQIQVIGGDGDAVALCSVANSTRYISYNYEGVGVDAFTGYVKDDRGDLVLSEYPTERTPELNVVTNLNDRELAIISVRNAYGWGNNGRTDIVAVTNETQMVGNNARLKPLTVEWGVGTTTSVVIPDNEKSKVYWNFEAVDASKGQYYVKDSAGNYLNIGNETATVGNEEQVITVTSQTVDGHEIINLSATVNGITYYLNRFGGSDKNNPYAGYNVNDQGCRFILTREYGLRATVLSRAELRDQAMMPNAQLVIFVRQKNADGVYQYYAIDGYGAPVEIYFDGETLERGSVVYARTADKNLCWDATGSPTGGWGSRNDVNGWINLQPKNVGTANYLIPHIVSNENADATAVGYSDYWHKSEKNDKGPDHDGFDRVVSPTSLRGENNPGFYHATTLTQNSSIDQNIASTFLVGLASSGNTMTHRYALRYDNGRFDVLDGWYGSDGNTKVTSPQSVMADDRYAFYFAKIDTNGILPEVVDTETDNLVGQILTRGEIQEAAKEYGANWPFIIIARGDDENYYALDSRGVAQPVEFIKDNGLKAGDRFIFQTAKANMAGYEDGESYNPNRILWDSSAVKYDKFAENLTDDNWIDLWMSNVATGQYLSPSENGLTASSPAEGEHSPGFFRVDRLSGGNNNPDDIASYLAAKLGTIDDKGKITGDPGRYSIELNGHDEFTVVNGWGTPGNELLSNLKGDDKDVFYVAMLVDRNVTYNPDKSIQEYLPFDGVNENVRMYVFNYGSAVDLYGQFYNNTEFSNEERPGVEDKWLDYGYNLAYRFFYRPSFSGEAIDGTNDPNNLNMSSIGKDKDGKDTAKNLYSDGSDPFDVASNRVFYNKLVNGFPAIKGPTAEQVGNVGKVSFVNDFFSLGYLFDPKGFIGNTVSEKNEGYKNLVISDSAQNGELHPIDGNNGTKVNSVDGKTPPANENDSVADNPNYAVRSYKVGNGYTTGLFQKDTEGYYFYDSKVNAAVYNEESGLFELYRFAMIPGGYNSLDGGNFLPFNNATTQGRLITAEQIKAGLNGDSARDETEGLGNNPIRPNTTTKATRYYKLNGFKQNSGTSIGRESMADLWMGMSIEIDFTMTKDGKVRVTNKKPLYYRQEEAGTKVYLEEQESIEKECAPYLDADSNLYYVDDGNEIYTAAGFLADDTVTIGSLTAINGVGMDNIKTYNVPEPMSEVRECVRYDGNDGKVYWYDEKGTKNVYTDEGWLTDKKNIDSDLTETRNDLVFSFAGDDDVLVYVDDYLLMDMNGIHGVWEGNINFATGKVTNNQYKDSSYTNEKTIRALIEAADQVEDKTGEVSRFGTGDLVNTFAPDSSHTLKFFYLERGGNISDCAICFNMEPQPTGALSVSKQVEGLDENDNITDAEGNEYSYDGEYTFQLVDIIQHYDEARALEDPSSQGVVWSVPYQITFGGTSRRIGELQLKPVEREMTLQMTNGGTETEVFQLCRYYEGGLPEASKGDDGYIEILRFVDEDDNVWFYSDEDDDGKYEKQMVDGIADRDTEQFYKVFESDFFTIKNGETAYFDEFIVGTLVKVKEFPVANGVALGTTYWWKVTQGAGATSNEMDGLHQAITEEGTGAKISNYFKIADKTNVDIVCKNILEPVNLGIKKILLNRGADPANYTEDDISKDTETVFNIKYTITYPKSEFYRVEEDGLHEYNLVQQSDGTTQLVKGDLMRTNSSNIWALTNGKDYNGPNNNEPNIVDTNPECEKITFATQFVGTGADLEQTGEYQWTVNVPFGSIVEIDEIWINGYKINWNYEGYDYQYLHGAYLGLDGKYYLADELAEKEYVKTAEHSGIMGTDGSSATNPAVIKLLSRDNYVTVINTPVDSTVTLTKKVEAGTTNAQFEFEYFVKPGEKSGLLTLTDGESNVVGDIPAGSTVTITEKDAEAYLTSYEVHTYVQPNEMHLNGGSKLNTSGYVGYILGDSQTVDFVVYAPEAGDYPLTLTYAQDATRSFGVAVMDNQMKDVRWVEVPCESTGAWNVTNDHPAKTATVNLSLAEGKNVITIGGMTPGTGLTNNADAPNLYNIDVTLSTMAPGKTFTGVVYNPIYVTCNNNLTYELPESGGAGTFLYILGGLFMMAAPVVYGFSKRFRRERRVSA